MRWVLRLIATEGDARCLSTDLIEICRPEGLGDIADLGLTLPEAKQLLASVQRAVIAAQAASSPSDSGFQLTVGATPKSPPWLPLTAD